MPDLDLDHDMQHVFYGSDFGMRYLRIRPGVDDLELQGIFGMADSEALEGYAHATTRVLQCPASHDVRADDILQALDALPQAGVSKGDRMCVLDTPERVNDGSELRVLLGSARS